MIYLAGSYQGETIVLDIRYNYTYQMENGQDTRQPKKSAKLPLITLALVILFGALISFFYMTKTKSQTPQESKQLSSQNPQTNQSSPEAVFLPDQKYPFPVLSKDQITGKKVHLVTSKGDIIFTLADTAPIASSNFIYLVSKGFYNGLTFHRREEGFVIQGGDPSGDGTGDPGYKFPDEPFVGQYTKGTVAMANSGPDTNGSQFFIMLADTPLPKNYTIFGKVVEGQDVVDSLQIGDTIQKASIE